jgi:hypothetical protein
MNQYMNILLTIMFIVFFGFFASNVTQSFIYDVMQEDAFISWLALVIVLLAGISAVVASHSVIFFLQEGKNDDLIYSICCIDVFILSFIYFISHEVNALALPIAPSKEKNVEIVAILALLVGLSVVFQVLYGRKDKSRRGEVLSYLSGFIIVPIIALIIILSPQPFFELSTSSGDLTSTGIFILVVFLSFMIVGIVKNGKEWINTSHHSSLARVFACVLWIFSIIYFGVQTLSFQVTEIIGLGSMLAGFSFLAVSMVAVAIVEPHRSLKALVTERTAELSNSLLESEYYLNMWSHEVGNMLQGIVGVLDLLTFEISTSSNDELLSDSYDVIRRLAVSTKQVRMLAGMKALTEEKYYPIDIYGCVTEAVKKVRLIPGFDELDIRINFDNNVMWVMANEFLTMAIFNLISYITNRDPKFSNLLSIDIIKSESHADLKFTREGFSLTDELRESLFGSLQPQTTVLGLDLFSAKIVTQQFGGVLRYEQIDVYKNRFSLHIPTTRLNR